MNLNSATFAAVVAQAKAKVTSMPRWERAITRASEALLSEELIVTLLADGGLVSSPRGCYRVSNNSCECEASRRGHRECRHVAAVRLVELYETAPAAPARASLIADIKAAWPKTWPPLATELMRRFRVNQLEMLSVDFLTAIRAAIA